VEEDLAQFMNEEAAIFFNAVSDASAGVITAIVYPPLLPILEGVSTDELGSCAVFVIFSTTRTGIGNRRRVGSCTTWGAESSYRFPRVLNSHPPAARTFFTHSDWLL
jgi:hypothetical protein